MNHVVVPTTCEEDLQDMKNKVQSYLDMTMSVPGDTLYARLVYLVNLYDISEEEAGR